MRLIRETVAQDLIEYAVLTAFVAFTSWLSWNEISTALANANAVTEQRMNDLSRCTPNPINGVRGGQCEP